MKYTELTFTELVNKIGSSRYFDLPKMLKEAFTRLANTPSYEPPYKVYTALLNQTGTNAPVATVLENTLGGTVVWTRNSPGLYIATLIGAFPLGKTYGNATFSFDDAAEGYKSIGISRNNNNVVQLRTSDGIIGGSSNDGLMLEPTSIEIRVYN